jgi:hypothetical protein
MVRCHDSLIAVNGTFLDIVKIVFTQTLHTAHHTALHTHNTEMMDCVQLNFLATVLVVWYRHLPSNHNLETSRRQARAIRVRTKCRQKL